METTDDGFLDRRLKLLQPRDGFRAGHDSVLLAAAVPAREGETVVELGSGAGVAALCLAWRVKCRLLGIEIDPELANLANENARRNFMADRVRFQAGDVLSLQGIEPPDHIFFNPPFHPELGQESPYPERALAKQEDGDTIANWAAAALALVKPEGTVSFILRGDALSDVIALSPGREVTIFPLMPREDERPKRMIVRVQEGDDYVNLAGGLVLHGPDGAPTKETEAVLRGGAALKLSDTMGVLPPHDHESAE